MKYLVNSENVSIGDLILLNGSPEEFVAVVREIKEKTKDSCYVGCDIIAHLKYWPSKEVADIKHLLERKDSKSRNYSYLYSDSNSSPFSFIDEEIERIEEELTQLKNFQEAVSAKISKENPDCVGLEFYIFHDGNEYYDVYAVFKDGEEGFLRYYSITVLEMDVFDHLQINSELFEKPTELTSISSESFFEQKPRLLEDFIEKRKVRLEKLRTAYLEVFDKLKIFSENFTKH